MDSGNKKTTMAIDKNIKKRLTLEIIHTLDRTDNKKYKHSPSGAVEYLLDYHKGEGNLPNGVEEGE